MESSNSPFLIELSPRDNVVIVARSLKEGEECRIAGTAFLLPQPLGLGHKLASRDIGAGEKVLKYGAPIGSATRTIARGEHVHMHNMKSDYLPTFTLDQGQNMAPINGYLRADGRKGIRNQLLVAYLVECAHHVAREITYPYRERGAQLIGFSGCYPNPYSFRMMTQLCSHPNVGGVLLISLGCEGFDRRALLEAIRQTGRPAELLVIQQSGGTSRTIRDGRATLETMLEKISHVPRAEMKIQELVVGTVCGGSDGTSGITANPAIGLSFDRLVAEGGTAIFEETGELIGCEQIMAARAATPDLGRDLEACVGKAAVYYATLGHGSFAPGNADGGLTTQEEKSMGAYAKSGSSPISGIIEPGDVPERGGLYLLDVVPDGDVRFGFPNINDNAEIAELIACGSHLILFATGRGSVVGSVISPVIKVCANPETFRNMEEDMDVDAGRILEGRGQLAEVGGEIYEKILRVAAGEPTQSERLGHQEFVLTYKSFEPAGPACYPA